MLSLNHRKKRKDEEKKSKVRSYDTALPLPVRKNNEEREGGGGIEDERIYR
jgi:hypothetical protein